MKRPYRGSGVELKRNTDRVHGPASISSNKEITRRVELPSINKNLHQRNPTQQEDEHYKQQNYIDEALGNLFHEYFIKNGYMKTLDSFQRQQGQGSDKREPQEFKRLLLESFDNGSKGQFFRVFNKYTPLHIRMKDERTTKLEFYLNIYFLIFKVLPAHHPNPLKKKVLIDNETRQSFQKYLKSKGEVLASTSQFLPYYALAYIEPFENPEFRQLFTSEWVEQLREKVVSFVDCLYPVEKPMICQIYEDYVEKSLKESVRQTSTFNNNDVGLVAKKDQEIEELQRRNYKMQSYLQSLTDKYWQFQNNFKKFGQNTKNTLIQSQKKWFQMTQEIFLMAASALQIAQNRKGQHTPESQAQIKRIRERMLKYQGFVNTNIDDLISQDVDFSMFEKPSVSAENQVQREVTEVRANTFVNLDIKKIKEVLVSQNVSQIIAILKALKYRIKIAQGVYHKRQVVVELAHFDIFEAVEEGQPLLNKLLFEDRAVCEEIVKLVSVLANDYYGRTYLFSAVDPLINLMMGEKEDTTVRWCLIVTFEFMSVRRRGQHSMINKDFIKWIVNILKNQKETLTEDSLSYLAALLMNLSFRKEGLDKCEEIRDELMSNLIELLEHKNKDIQSYINGTLYRVLSRKYFREKAREHGLADIIDYQIKSGASVDCTQLNHVKGMLDRQDEEYEHLQEETDMEDLDDGDDVDDIDDQPFMMSHLLNDQEETEEVNGERLLIESYTLAGPEIISHMKAISKQVDESLKRKETSFIRNEMSSQDRPRSMMRPLVRNRSNISSNRGGSASNRMLPSQLRQRVRPYVQGEEQQAPVSPMSRESSLGNSQLPHPIREYQNHPQYRQIFQPRNQIIRTPPHSNM